MVVHRKSEEQRVGISYWTKGQDGSKAVPLLDALAGTGVSEEGTWSEVGCTTLTLNRLIKPARQDCCSRETVERVGAGKDPAARDCQIAPIESVSHDPNATSGTLQYPVSPPIHPRPSVFLSQSGERLPYLDFVFGGRCAKRSIEEGTYDACHKPSPPVT